jgi:hypothetical protein
MAAQFLEKMPEAYIRHVRTFTAFLNRSPGSERKRAWGPSAW